MDPKLLQQIEQYLKDSGLNAQELKNRMDAVRSSTVEFNRELSNAQRYFNELNSDVNDLSQQFKNVLDDLRKWDSTSSRINRSFKTLGGLAEKLKYDAQEISTLNIKDLKSLEKKAEIELSNLKARKDELDAKFKNLSVDRVAAIAAQTKNKDLAKQASQYIELNSLIDKNGQLINDENNYLKTLLSLITKRQKEEEKINKTLGISGKIVDGIVGSLGKLGISSDFFENLKDNMRETAKSGDKWKTMMTGVKGIVGGIGDAFNDPIVKFTLLLKIAKFFFQEALKSNTQIVELGKALGRDSYDYRQNLTAAARASDNINVTTENLVNSFNEIAQATGFAYEYTVDQLETQVKLTKQVGLQADEAAQIQRLGVLNNKTSEQTYNSFVRGLTATRNQLKVGINFKATLAEALKVSGQLAANLGFNPERIARAVVATKALGMTLEQTAKSADSLLNFESSIENQLKAELLTGKQLNLERARAAALMGDQVTVAEEIAKNVGTAAEFAKMNVFQQRALAESVGMTADELSETLRKREEAIASGKSLAQITEEEAKQAIERQNIQDKFNQSILKLQDIFGNLMAGPLGTFLDMLSGILGFIGKIISGIQQLFGSAITKTILGAGVGIATGGVGLTPALVGGGLGLASELADDIVSSPGYGQRTLLAPEGAIKLNDKDTIIAGTNLGGGNNNQPQQSLDISPIVNAMKEVKAAIISGNNKTIGVNLDGREVGTGVVRASYKSA